VGARQFLDVGDLKLESGEVLPGVRLAYETWGRLDAARGNAVLVLHALTGDSHVVGPAGPGHPTPGWWEGLIGPGKPIDTERFFVVAPNVLGGCQGSTGPASTAPDGSPWGSRFPFITVRDQVAAEIVLADTLGIDRWAGVIGGSMGGMRAAEWAAGEPDRVAGLVLLATCAAATADQIGLSATQISAIAADAGFAGGDYYDAPAGGGPHLGLGVARRMAHLSYRSEAELGTRFGRASQRGEDPFDGGRYAVESYLDHHAAKLTWRFDANSYVVLSRAMNSHDVGRDRGGAAAALGRITARTVVAGIDSDRLYPLAQQEELARHIPSCERLEVIRSHVGHDGFLVEVDAVGELIRDREPFTAAIAAHNGSRS
jgi:homoserine O-acetyltransferase